MSVEGSFGRRGRTGVFAPRSARSGRTGSGVTPSTRSYGRGSASWSGALPPSPAEVAMYFARKRWRITALSDDDLRFNGDLWRSIVGEARRDAAE